MIAAGKVDKAKIVEAVKVAEPLIPQPNLDKAADVFIKQSQDFCEQEKTDVLGGDNAKKEICESGFLDGVLRDADELEKYFKDNGIPEVAQRLAQGDRFIRTPYKNRDSNSPRAWWHDYLWRVADTYPKLKEKLEAAGREESKDAPAASAPAGAGKETPFGITVKRLEGHIPSPFDPEVADAKDTKGTVVAEVEYEHPILTRTRWGLVGGGSFEYQDAAGFPNTSASALLRGLRARKTETEFGASLSLNLPLNGSLDTGVAKLDLVSTNPLAKELTEKAKARWGDKATQIYLDAVRGHFEDADEDHFTGYWNGLTTSGATWFESLLSDSNLPTKAKAIDLVALFLFQPSGLIDLIALWSGKSVSEIKTGLSLKGVDLAKFEASKSLPLDDAGRTGRVKLFEDLLEKAGTLGLTKQFKLAKDYDDHVAVSTIKLPADPEKFKKALGLDGYEKALKAKEEEIAKALGMTPAELKKAAEVAKEDYPFELVAGKNDRDNPWRLEARVNQFIEKKLGVEADKVFTLSLGAKSDPSLNVYPVVGAALPLPLYKSDNGFLRGATLIFYGEYNAPVLGAPAEERMNAFVGLAKLKTKLHLVTDLDASFKWIGVGLKPSEGDFEVAKHILDVDLRVALGSSFFLTGGYTAVIQGNKDKQTAANGLNDGTSGSGDGGSLDVLVGRNERILRLGVGYQFTKNFSLSFVGTQAQSCDVLAETDCISRSFVGFNSVFSL